MLYLECAAETGGVFARFKLLSEFITICPEKLSVQEKAKFKELVNLDGIKERASELPHHELLFLLKILLKASQLLLVSI